MQPYDCILGQAWWDLLLQVVPDYSWVPLFLQIDSTENQGIRKHFFASLSVMLGLFGRDVLRPSGL